MKRAGSYAARYRLTLDSSGLTSTGENDLSTLLHPRIQTCSSQLFRDGHYSQAIFEAFKALEHRVREMTGIDSHGRHLMTEAFRQDAPVLRLNDLSTRSDRDEQEGFKLIFMGAAQGIRNPKAHDVHVQQDARRTLDYLSLASLLMDRLDDAADRLT